MMVVQCWDDGVTSDIRLIAILRKYNARATFNLNAGLHGKQRRIATRHKGTDVVRLGRGELRDVYDGFTIGNHSLTHPRLETLEPEAARQNLAEGRERLQQIFQQPVLGLAYPFGSFNTSVMQTVRETGHVYARTTGSVEKPFPPEQAMAFHPSCHFLASDFNERYERTRSQPGGVFYFWGHSYELVNEAMWRDFETAIARIAHDPLAQWGELVSLFDFYSDIPCPVGSY